MNRTPRAYLFSLRLLALLIVGSLVGWNPAPTAAVTLDSLLITAMRENPRVRSLEASHRAARARIPQAGALPNPELVYAFEGAPLDRPLPAEAMENRVSISQMIPFPGKRGLSRSMASREAEMAEAGLERARLEVAFELWRAYADLVWLHESMEVIEENLGTLRSLSQIAHTRYEVGTGTLQDPLRTNVDLSMEEARLAVLRERIPAVLARVNALLGRPPEAPIGTPEAADPPSLPELSELESRALRYQPLIEMRERAVARDEIAVRRAGREGYPDFMVGAGYMAMKGSDDGWMGMLGATLPIWRGSTVGPARQEARAGLARAEADLDQARLETLSMVRQAWAGARADRLMLTLYQTSVLPQAQQSFAAARVAYETNRATFLDLLDSQRTLLRFQLEASEARAAEARSRAELGLAVGDPDLLGIPEVGSDTPDRDGERRGIE